MLELLAQTNVMEQIPGAPLWLIAGIYAFEKVVNAGFTIKTGMKREPTVGAMRSADLPCNDHREKLARLDATVQAWIAEGDRRFSELRGDVIKGFDSLRHRLDSMQGKKDD